MAGFRPSQWDQTDTLTYGITDINGVTWFFDAIMKADHVTALKITDHPVQNGANMVDHAYILPAHLVLEISMSDVMDSFIADQFTGDYASRSVSAYQQLLKMQADRLPLTVTARLNSFDNMLIESIATSEDNKNIYSMKALVTFKQIFVAQVSTLKVSAREYTTEQTNKGSVQPQPLTPQQQWDLSNVQTGTSPRYRVNVGPS